MNKGWVSADFSKRVHFIEVTTTTRFSTRIYKINIKFSFAEARHQFMATTGK
jgi:hypothetical protein